MAKREFLMLAHTFKNEPIGGWYWSEKLDGCRAYWDGGITRGKPAAEVPFANTTKDARYVTPPKATGLWSRYGKPIQAPDWWLDKLPQGVPLDGELYIERGAFQTLMSTVKTLIPGPGWSAVKYMAFDMPPYHAIFANGDIDNVNFRKSFRDVGTKLRIPYIRNPPSGWDFHSVHNNLREREERNEVFQVHEQIMLPSKASDAGSAVSDILEKLLVGGAEGMMVRNPSSFWAPQRARTLLKIKGMNDAEATVVGYTWGRETDKGSKLLGKMGALVVQYAGKTFELSGFTDDERSMRVTGGTYDAAFAIGCQSPGGTVPENVHNPRFPRGSVVTFRYRELTDAGIPKEARYWRKYDAS